jgi:hypothetical protein
MAAEISAMVRRHEPRVWLLWAVGFVILLCTPAALVDPGILALALDPELVALIVLSSVGVLHATASRFVLRAFPVSIARRSRSSRVIDRQASNSPES